MELIERGRKNLTNWPVLAVTLFAAIAAFCCYTSMYAFRKAFAAGTFDDQVFLHVDLKVWLVLTQMVGYTLSKFYGIRFIAEASRKKRGIYLVRLILISWTALLAFALVPAPWNILFFLLNGFPLGMIWGLVFSYLEGRKTTEFMGAVMSISLIFASGFVKTVARTMMTLLPVNEYWMPFCTGLLFIIPFLLSVYCLELIPAPSNEDEQFRTKRVPMNAMERKNFLMSFLPGILVTLIIYVLLTILRDMRDNFEVEIWAAFDIHDNHIYTQIDTIVSLVVLVIMGLLILIRNNQQAFMVIHLIIISGCLMAGVATWAFDQHYIGPISWMCIVGMGLYMGYIPYNAIFYERMIANFHLQNNIGFAMYISDSMGYLGSASILVFKQFHNTELSWGLFFKQTVYTVAIVGAVCGVISMIYFFRKRRNYPNSNETLTKKPVAAVAGPTQLNYT
ncbi:DUF5690 family protein [Pedobacter duraquae]|uniref:MFS transporter n=1 Tax=Pedobacter duraquae TaxID=425511 RepID=A0A4R6IIB9_9SPHI|nr:DUF5690 family protein [Pedobacter duraquae]TDO21665.1 hypothetical protein CLV32_2771 [Pedobacter duraquae]